MQYYCFVVHYKGMASIVATLKSYYYIGALGEKVDYFTFAFISPLRAY